MAFKSLRIAVLVFSFIITGESLFAQASTQEKRTEVFAPFVSRLKAKAGQNDITLTWKDSKDVRGINLIYRSKEEITDKNIDNATFVASIKQGIETYKDHPPTTDKYFYAVLLKDEKGKIYKILIPYRNKTTIGIAVKSVATEEELAAKITNIKATPRKDFILIQFTSSNSNREVLLFRNTSPLKNTEDLLRSVSPIVLGKGKTSYTDYPIPGIKYYYAVIDAGLFKIGKATLVPGENATTQPAMIPLGEGRPAILKPQEKRPLPLPYLLITESVSNGKELFGSSPFHLPKKKKLSPATTKALISLLSDIKLPPKPEMKVEILKNDREVKSGGENYTLARIVHDKLARGKYKESQTLLENFLSIYHSKDVEYRSRFYLGQSYFFQGNYKKAFIEFLMSEDGYYRESNRWIDACYSKLIES